MNTNLGDRSLEQSGWRIVACYANNDGERLLCWTHQNDGFILKFYGRGQTRAERFYEKDKANARVKELTSMKERIKTRFVRDYKKERFFGLR